MVEGARHWHPSNIEHNLVSVFMLPYAGIIDGLVPVWFWLRKAEIACVAIPFVLAVSSAWRPVLADRLSIIPKQN